MDQGQNLEQQLLPVHSIETNEQANLKNAILLIKYLDEDLLNFVVIEDSRVSPRAFTESSVRRPGARHAHASGEQGSTIGEEFHLLEISRVERVGGIGFLLRQTLVKSPLSHNKGIINREAVDLINTESFNCIVATFISW